MRINTVLWYHLTFDRMALMRCTKDRKCRWVGEKYSEREQRQVQPLWESAWRFLKELTIEVPCDSAR